MKLFEEHFGTGRFEQYRDPVPLESWFAMQDQAMQNASIYENVFGCLPEDSIKRFRDMGVQFVRLDTILISRSGLSYA
jgi:hypothetical protein